MTTSKKLSLPNVTGNHCMTWKELSEADDFASAITIDAFLGFKTHKMTEMKIRIPERIRLKLRDTLVDFQKRKCYETAYSTLTADINILKPSWRCDERFRNHVYRYLLLFDDRSGVEIRPCYRYASEGHVGAAVFATKHWAKGARINTLVGCIAELNRAEETAFLKHHKNDFSVMYSSRKNCSQLWLGPAAYVNHDCQPNCEFTINCDEDARMSLEAKVDIKNGDEIFIYYGNHFFDVNNNACECFTCELLGRGYFSKLETTDSILPTQECNQPTNSGAEQINCVISDSTKTYQNTSSNATPAGNLTLTSLRKGSSTGLARRSMPTSYSLRHTDSRLNRVKARLLASTEKALAISTTSAVPSTCRSIKNRSQSRDSYSQPVRRSLRLGSSATRSGVLSQTDTPLPYYQPQALSSNWSAVPVHPAASTTAVAVSTTAFSDSTPTSSPFPPQLERMSSELASMASTASDTPDLAQSYYRELRAPLAFQQESCSPWGNATATPSTHEDSARGWCGALPCHLSSETSTATSPACAVEPILGRLWSETQPNSSLSSSIGSAHSSPPLLTRQQARAQEWPAGVTSPSPSLLDASTCVPQATAKPPNRQAASTGDAEFTFTCRETSDSAGPNVNDSDFLSTDKFGHCLRTEENRSAELSPMSNILDSSPPNLTPVSLVGSRRLLNDKTDIAPDTSRIVGKVTPNNVVRSGQVDSSEQNGHLVGSTASQHLVDNEMQFDPDYGASPPELRTPLRTKGNLNYLFSEHDYAKRTLLPSYCHSPSLDKVMKLCGSQLVSKAVVSKLSPLRVRTTPNKEATVQKDSPSPPTLLPAPLSLTPGNTSDQQTSTLLSVLREPAVYPAVCETEGRCSVNSSPTKNVCPLPHRLWSPMKNSDRLPCSNQSPLIVTLKRVSATHYQISKPSRVFLTK